MRFLNQLSRSQEIMETDKKWAEKILTWDRYLKEKK
jgi:hypothetical protein